MNSNNRIRDMISAGVGAGLLVALLQIPASAAPDAGEPVAISNSVRVDNCPLERVGLQYVRCDDLSGAGVEAPSWLPERAGIAEHVRVEQEQVGSAAVQTPRSLLR